MRLIYEFELSEEEKSKIRAIQKDFENSLIENNHQQDSFETYAETYGKMIRNIYKTAHQRSLKYFTTNTKELLEALQQEAKNSAAALAMTEKVGRSPKVDYKTSLIRYISPYLEIIKKQSQRDYKKLMSFIDEAFKHRVGILAEENDKNKPLLEREYAMYAQNEMTNKFNKLAQLKDTRGEVKKFAGALTFTQDEITVKIPNYEKLLRKGSLKGAELNTTVKKVLDIAVIIYTHTHSTLVKFRIDDYMRLCGLTDKKEARKQINDVLDILFELSISWDNSAKKDKSRSYDELRVIGRKGVIENGIVYFKFFEDFARELDKMPVMPYPLRMLKASKGREHRNTYYLVRKLTELKNMNAGKKNEHIFSVKSLLTACPFLPTYEEVKNSNRHFRDRIIDPFIDDFEEALNILGIGQDGYEWHYEGGIEISFEELKELAYDTFIDAYIRTDDWEDYPEMKVIENKEKRQKTAEEANEKPRHKSNRKKKSN